MEQLKKLRSALNNDMLEELEKSVKRFSKEYAETNETPYLFDSIYENKINEIISLLLNKNSSYLIKNIKNGNIKIKDLVYMKPEELNPSKFDDIIKKRELTEIKKNTKQGSTIFECPKCKKAKCTVSMKQNRPGDEPPDTEVNCLECGYKYCFEQ